MKKRETVAATLEAGSMSAPRRREFLKTQIALGGSFFVGISACSTEPVAMKTDATGAMKAGGYTDAWIRISPDNSVTILSAKSEMGQGVATSMPLLIAEELEYPIDKVKVEFAPLGAPYGNDALGGAAITGGSTSVRDGYIKLRKAGAAAREVLVATAAKQWNVPASECKTDGTGKVVHTSGKSMTYGQLAGAANGMALPKDPKIKDPAQFTQIGKANIRRIDTLGKVNGTTVFGIDVKAANMGIAALAQSPVLGGKVKSFDATAAKAMKGVYGVYQITDGVAVVARDFYIARKARDTIKIDWDLGPAATVSTASMRAAIEKASSAPGASIRADGNFDQVAGASGAKKLSAKYTMPMLSHMTMEPVNCTAEFAGGKCIVTGPIQFQTGVAGTAAAIAKAAGLDEKNVDVRTVYLGGGFGRKIELDFVQQSIEIAKQAGRPVKLIWTREDDMQHDFYRPMSLHQVDGVVDGSGKLAGISAKMTSASITKRAFPPFFANGVDPFMNEGSGNLTYKIPAIRINTVVEDSPIRVGYWRSVSNPLNSFAIESMVDELAAAAGKDPLSFRMAALEGAPRAQKVLQAVADKSGWAGKKNAVGLAQMECYDTFVAMAIEVNPAKPLEVKRITCAVDCGVAVHPDQVVAQIEGAIVMSLTAALYGNITVKDGRVEQSNFGDQRSLRMTETPPIDVIIANTPGNLPGGMGEVGVPLVAPAFANAIAAATGKRLRDLPFTSV